MSTKLNIPAIIVIISVCFKVVLIPSYTSTDFEVHRNWLAITYSLPIEKWYFENTSEWTLDYPPFFAWFEKGLSHIAVNIDNNMVNTTNLKYKSDATLYFQRSSVMAADLVLIYSGYKCSKLLFQQNNQIQLAFFALLVLNAGLMIVDHIHFQYNGFLFGILFLSLGQLANDNVLQSAFWFAVLLNFKHIFLYIAPAYGIFFLRIYCLDSLKNSFALMKSLKWSRFFYLAFIVLTVFAASFGPFSANISQVIKRLFPFKRGLTHAYWAPNFWALYNFIDRVLAVFGKRLGLLSIVNLASSTSGLVQTVEHAVLPSVPPILTFLITFLSMAPCLIKVILKPKSNKKEQFNQFLRVIVLCSLCSFMFGWHVHEKAILMAILPCTLLAFTGKEKDAQIFLFLQTVGHYSLFPLLFTPFESVIKICLLLFYTVFAFSIFSQVYPSKHKLIPCVSKLESYYLLGLIVVELACIFFPLLGITKHLEFLPLMIISTYCAIGISWTWLSLYAHVLCN